MSARDRLEALRRLNGRIEGLERQRARTPKEVGRLTRFARALRRERRRLVLEAGGVGRIGSDGGGGRPGHSRCGRESRPRPLDHRAADRGVGEGAAPATRVRAGIGAGVGFGGDRPMSTAAEQLEQHPHIAERASPGASPVADGLSASLDSTIGANPGVVPLGVLGVRAQRVLEVASRNGLVARPDDLDVLLRHRPRSISPCLRQQRHGFHPFTEFQEGLALPVIEVAA